MVNCASKHRSPHKKGYLNSHIREKYSNPNYIFVKDI